MAKVIIGGYQYVEKEVEVSDNFLPIIAKANKGEDFDGCEFDLVDELEMAAVRAANIDRCNCIYVGTLDGHVILED